MDIPGTGSEFLLVLSEYNWDLLNKIIVAEFLKIMFNLIEFFVIFFIPTFSLLHQTILYSDTEPSDLMFLQNGNGRGSGSYVVHAVPQNIAPD
jgi:hypothetical protein